MKFEWDDDKNRQNIEKHGLSFRQAAKIFDGFTISRVDDRQDYGEKREISIGLLGKVIVIVVVHTERNGSCRLISARQANRKEREHYEQEIQKALDA